MLVVRAWRVVEATVLLVGATILRKTIPMKRWSTLLGSPTEPTPPLVELAKEPLTGRDADVASAIQVARHILPYQPNCLDQATAAQLMLRFRGQPGSVIIGLEPANDWKAHAWLIGRSGTVVGGDVSDRFTPATAFRVNARQDN